MSATCWQQGRQWPLVGSTCRGRQGGRGGGSATEAGKEGRRGGRGIEGEVGSSASCGRGRILGFGSEVYLNTTKITSSRVLAHRCPVWVIAASHHCSCCACAMCCFQGSSWLLADSWA